MHSACWCLISSTSIEILLPIINGHILRVQVQFSSCILNLYKNTHVEHRFYDAQCHFYEYFLICVHTIFRHESHERWKDLVKNGWKKNKYHLLHLKMRWIHFVHIHREISFEKKEKERESYIQQCVRLIKTFSISKVIKNWREFIEWRERKKSEPYAPINIFIA